MAVIKIPYKKTNGIIQHCTITFPNIEDLEENNFLRKARFYLKFKIDTSTAFYELGKIENMVDKTINESELPTTISSSKICQSFLCFKFDDDTLNNSTYNEKINCICSGYTDNFYNNYEGYTGFDGYFLFRRKTSSSPMYAGGSSVYNISNFTGELIEVEPPEELPEEPETPIEPTNKTITLTLHKTDNSTGCGIRSNIELYYNIQDTNELVRLGTSKENDSFTITFDDTKAVNLYFRYVNQNIDISKCVECFQLDNTDVYSVYVEDLLLFSLGSITESDTLRERKYACPMLDLQLQNCTCNITEIDYTHDTIIEVSAKDNYFFNVEPFIYLKQASYGTQKKILELNEDRTKASITITAVTPLNNFFHDVLQAIAEIQTIISQDYGLISIYKPNSEILKQLPSKTLYEKSYLITDSGIQKETIDLSKNIINVLSMPLDVATVGTKEITLQGISTSLTSEYINNNIYKIDFGRIYIASRYNNSMAYKNTKVSVYLAFIGLKELNTSKYINKYIRLKYTVDLFTGDFLAELIDDTLDLVLDTFSGNLAIKVPYITNSEKSQNISNYNLLDKNNLLNDRKNKIIVETNRINEDTIYDTLEYTQSLSTLQGYNVIENIKLPSNTKLSKYDLEQIETLLQSGIIF